MTELAEQILSDLQTAAESHFAGALSRAAIIEAVKLSILCLVNDYGWDTIDAITRTASVVAAVEHLAKSRAALN